ncbi:MAG: dual specificity protein phosphatase family protein, partial [Deltaproteobacteria bacterium]|nr:dual specificity protein phosphatase family protein [Deltaproteobacteria bacterium]
TPYVMDGFSFVDAHVAGMPQPGSHVPLADDLDFLVEQGIDLLVSLTVTPTDPLAVDAAGLALLHLPIVDFTPPTLEQQQTFVAETQARVEQDERVGVHDTAGFGRCGTMLATWFVAKGMTAEDAMEEIRLLRPGSIETIEQEQAVIDYEASLAEEGL